MKKAYLIAAIAMVLFPVPFGESFRKEPVCSVVNRKLRADGIVPSQADYCPGVFRFLRLPIGQNDFSSIHGKDGVYCKQE